MKIEFIKKYNTPFLLFRIDVTDPDGGMNDCMHIGFGSLCEIECFIKREALIKPYFKDATYQIFNLTTKEWFIVNE